MSVNDRDDEFLGTLLRRNAEEIFFPGFCRHGVIGLAAQELKVSQVPSSIRHRSPAILAIDFPVKQDAIPNNAICQKCSGVFWWRSHRGDTFCYRCRPPKRNSPTFVKQRLVYNDELQALENFDDALAGVGETFDTATQGPLRPQRPRRNGSGGELGPPPNMTIDEWWDSLIESGTYDSIVVTCEAHRASEERREALAAERAMRLAAKAGRGVKPGATSKADDLCEKNLTLTVEGD